jgi:hypothetical protein
MVSRDAESTTWSEVLAQLPQFEENRTDFQAFGRRKSLSGIARLGQGAM